MAAAPDRAPTVDTRGRLGKNRRMVRAQLPLALLVLVACGPDKRADTGAGVPTASDTAGATGTSAGTDGAATQAPTDGAGTDGASGEASTAGTGTGTDPGVTTDEASSGSTGSTGSTAATDASASSSSTGEPDVKLDLPVDMPIAVKDIPGLLSITFYETTGKINEYTFLVDGPELNTLLPDPLSLNNRDIQGTSVEFYDVYYSDVDGVFDPNGSYLTIAGAFGAKLPAGGGLNLAEISLNYDNNELEFGSFLASFVGLGDNYAPGSEVNAVDGDLATHTTMGNNVDAPDQRLRVTLGFKSSLMPG